MRTILWLVLLVAVIGLGAYIVSRPAATIASFEDCVAAGNPVMESWPRQCRTADGRLFVEELNTATSTDSVPRIAQPQPNMVVTSPLVVAGEAPGNWFFEASLPVSIVDSAGRVLAVVPAQAQGDWMTTDYVPFETALTFAVPTSTATGFVVVAKDNPSGLPELDRDIRIPIRFGAATSTAAACRPTGCSGQVCSDQEVVTTCEFRPEYACYKESFARCERQANGQCGWTQTPQLAACLQNPPQA